MCEPFFAHETSQIDDGCIIGGGTKIWHFSHVMTGCTIGENCNIGQNVVILSGATVGNGVKIQNNVSVYTGVICEDNVFLGPSCVFTNVINPRAFIPRKNEFRTTRIKRGASIGANATIVCGHTVGKYAMVGAGSVVTKDVPDHALVYGVPAKCAGYVCCCGERVSFDAGRATCHACGKRYVQNSKTLTVEELT